MNNKIETTGVNQAKVETTGVNSIPGFDPNFFHNPEGHIRDRIVINESPDIPKQGIFLSLNGYPFQAIPGKEIDIPRPVRLAIDTLIYTDTIQENGEEYHRDRPRLTYTIKELNVGGVNTGGASPAGTPAAN